jgi:hypothetical protein
MTSVHDMTYDLLHRHGVTTVHGGRQLDPAVSPLARLKEILLGGVTRTLLAQMPVPVLISRRSTGSIGFVCGNFPGFSFSVRAFIQVA